MAQTLESSWGNGVLNYHSVSSPACPALRSRAGRQDFVSGRGPIKSSFLSFLSVSYLDGKYPGVPAKVLGRIPWAGVASEVSRCAHRSRGFSRFTPASATLSFLFWCVFTCLARWSLRMKRLPHSGQAKRFSPV